MVSQAACRALKAGSILALMATTGHAATFTALGPTTLGANFFGPNGVSGDGTVVVGNSDSGPFRWTATTGAVLLTTLGGPSAATARRVSADGNTLVGNNFGAGRAYRWSLGGGTELLPNISFGGEGAFDVSADGSVIVGNNSGTGALWSGGGVSALPPLAGGNESIAFGVSDDGLVAVGRAGFREQLAPDGGEGAVLGPLRNLATRWDAGQPTALGVLPGGRNSRANAASANGSVIVGTSDVGVLIDGFEFTTSEAFRWTATGGLQPLGRSGAPLQPGQLAQSAALDISADGKVIGGFAGFGGPAVNPGGGAAVWIGDSGPLQVFALLVAQGATGLEGWTLDSVESVSADGRTLVGDGVFCVADTCRLQGWIATFDPVVVPAPAAAWLFGSALGLLGGLRRHQAAPSRLCPAG
ncbi:MAG: hypothetical protein JNM50_08915 [Chromatiales bacterium]|jgi:uncharacterized membrane protein|nr:hypothetical protein [Chromatiales bacterium]